MTATATIPTTVALLRRWAEEGGCLGGQVFVWRDGQVVADVAVGRDGSGRAASGDDVGRLYCAVKPVTSCCLARAVEAGEASFDDPVCRFVPELGSGRLARTTLRQLLAHASGLPDPPYDLYAVDFRETVARAATVELPAFYWFGEPRYNDTSAWNILAVVVERISGADFVDVVRRVVVEPAGLPSLRMVDPPPARYAPCAVVGHGGEFAPVAEPTPDVLFGHTNPAHGGFGAARDLGLLYVELLRCATGAGTMLCPAAARELTRPHGRVLLAPGFGHRTVGLGLFVNMSEDGFGGGWSRRSFGHPGLAGRYRVVYAFADPEHRVVVAIRLYSAGAKNNWRFQRLGAALWSDLEAASRRVPEPEPAGGPA